MSRVVVVFSDEAQKDRAEHTIRSIRDPGGWKGDLVWIAVGLTSVPSWVDTYNVEVLHRPQIDVSYLLEARRQFPFQKPTDNREVIKLIQFSKFWVFDIYFKKWDSILYMDAGMHVFQPLFPWFQIPHKGSFVAPDDRFPFSEPKTFRKQWDKTMWDVYHDLQNYCNAVSPKWLDQGGYFLNCVWLMCSSIIQEGTLQELQNLSRRFPISRTNEMAVMNLYLKKLWKPTPLGEILYFDWTNRFHHRNKEDYILLKYPQN